MSTFRTRPIAACAALLAGVATAQAQAPTPPHPSVQPPVPAASAPQLQPPAPHPDGLPGRGPAPDRAPERSFSGVVRSYLLTPAGDVAGLLLEDGTQVDVPPHLSSQLADGVHLRDRVEVTGVRAPGSSLVRASEVRDPASSTVVHVDGAPRATPPARAAAAPALAPMTTNGRIVALLYAPRGEVGGVLTQDGTQVRFPPQADSGRGLAVGQPVYARGFGTQGPHGRAMEATALGSTAGDAQAVFAPPAPRPGMPPAPDGAPPRASDAAASPLDR